MSLADIRKIREKRNVKICRVCGREIYPYEKAEYVKSRRGTENYYCEDCIERMRRKQKHRAGTRCFYIYTLRFYTRRKLSAYLY